MDSYDSHFTEGFSRGCSRSIGYSITHGESVSASDCCSKGISRSTSWAGTPSRSYAGDPATIARCIFRDELRDVLIILKNCGALRTAAETRWCIAELKRLIAAMGLGDLD